MEPILQTENLSRSFVTRGEQFFGVENVSFSLYPGEILGVLGESGSGKTTLARLVTGLLSPSEGKIFLDGTELTGRSFRDRIPMCRKIQMVFQHPVSSFDPRRTLGFGIGESLKNLGVPQKQREEQTAALLQACGLPEDFAFRYPHEVSGGQCQRAAIARALAVKPRVLILDEATSSLDLTVQAQILELLRRLQQENGLSYLFICHNPALVQDFAQQVMVMHRGRILEAGTTQAVFANPASDYMKKLLQDAF